MAIPVIDIFAGPGGLGEGFSALTDNNNRAAFKIALSIEKDETAHMTLTLRSFFRQFDAGKVPTDYYDFLKGKISLEDLYEKWPNQAKHAKKEAWCVALGEGSDAVPYKELDKRISESLNGKRDWLLIGGPPCQAYSVVGRSRRQDKVLDESKDERVGLYKQYLRILAVHNPAVFVMENVKGLLSAKTKDNSVFGKIMQDLADPKEVYRHDFKLNSKSLECPGYRIFSLVTKPENYDSVGNPIFRPKDFVIKAEEFGIPQTRHRVILLGIRKDILIEPEVLSKSPKVPISKVLSGLPKLRSQLSKTKDNAENWKKTVLQIKKKFSQQGIEKQVKEEINKQLNNLSVPRCGIGSNYIEYHNITSDYKMEWYIDENIGGVCNHNSRGHMDSDLLRYFFASSFAKVKRVSPKLDDFPIALLPEHKNVQEGIDDKKFADRFRVQLWTEPSKTITSHISKDGHYYIHPDPKQCRSLTVREAARIQTFPDNYYFCGGRTQQFHQVGNAVPPLLANRIARVVNDIFNSIFYERSHQHTKRFQDV